MAFDVEPYLDTDNEVQFRDDAAPDSVVRWTGRVERVDDKTIRVVPVQTPGTPTVMPYPHDVPIATSVSITPLGDR